jgi:gluconate 5-dehydrogenase
MINIKESFSLNGKTAFLTGSYRGLGFDYARALASVGAKVIVNGRSPEGVANAVKELRSEGFDAYGYAFDITNVEKMREAVRKIQDEHGFVEILVNNAGIQRRGPLEDISLEDWREVMDLNITALFTVSQLFAREMIKHKRGKIINIASLMSFITRPTTGPYTASKGAVVSLTKSMTVEWAQYNIQINAIAPGYYHTELTDKLVKDPEFNSWITRRTPAGRWGKPEDLRGTVVFLASPASDFINGQCIIVDGGITAAI